MMKNAVFQEVKDNGLAGMSEETAVKSVASIEFSHLKASFFFNSEQVFVI